MAPSLSFLYNICCMKKKVFSVLIIVLLLLSSCAKKASTQAVNEIRIGVAQDFDSLDPHHMTAAGTKEIMFNVYEGLVKPDSNGGIVGAVASSVEKSADGKTYTFRLRENVKFHNGKSVTAEDVVYSVNRRTDGRDSAAQLSALKIIESISADSDCVKITLKEASNEFLAALMNAYIIPADHGDLEISPVGTGPYRFVSRSVQDSVVLERFEDYWGEKAKTDRVIFRVLENAQALVLGLQSGALDLVAHLSSDQTVQLDGRSFEIEEGSMNLVQALYLNNAAKPFDSLQVRQAMCYAVDKRKVIELAFDGYGIPLGTSMFPSFGKYYVDELTDYYPYNPQKAKELLSQAGYTDGIDIVITVPSNYTPHVNAATAITEILKESGIRASIQLVDWGTWLEEVYSNRNYQSTVTGVTSDNMTARKLLERFGSGTGNNFTNYNNAEYDRILVRALAEPDDNRQTDLYKALERNLTENAANVYIQDMADLVAVRKGLKGLVFYPLYVLDVSTLYWEQ